MHIIVAAIFMNYIVFNLPAKYFNINHQINTITKFSQINTITKFSSCKQQKHEKHRLLHLNYMIYVHTRIVI